MYIEKLELNNFRNYKNQVINLDKNINVIYGNNAQGKTNIIESIYMCAYGKSFRAKKDEETIKFGEDLSQVVINYKRLDREGTIKLEIGSNKNFYINGIKQNKLSDIIGKINIVIFKPDDIDIIKDGPQKRRRFLDIMISSLKPNYLHLLNNYNKVLEQRNNYLRQIKFENKSKEMLEIWDEQLATYSEKISEYRRNFIEKIQERIVVIHKNITKSGKDLGNSENIEIKYSYNGITKKDFYDKLLKNRLNDIQKGYTTTGIHRDDFMIYINEMPVNVYGSQGQQRTSILALKLAELQIVHDEIGEEPILLLDDFMSELDENRRNSILENIKNNQVIITCTDKIEIEGVTDSIYYVSDGIANKIN